MGVRGLTTYLRENQRALSVSLKLPAEHATPTIVVDGWSFIYHLYRHSNLPWVYGGEYDQFSNLVIVVVEAWIKVGFRVYFVFDGASPEQKFSTIVSRLEESHVQPSLLFFRTSPSSRGTARFLNETRIIPPLAYTACVHALETLLETTNGGLKLFFADIEGDPYAVELAGKTGAYVAGSDSDFVILNTEGYLGYIPLEEMMWHAPPPEEAERAPPDDDEEFQPVRKPKSKNRPVIDATTGRGIIPPEARDGLVLSFLVYKPATLAGHLKIPVTLLPLLGSLLGNDFTKLSEAHQRAPNTLFFDKRLTLSQRINLVASTVREILSPASQKSKKKNRIGNVMDLIDRAVNVLLARHITNIGPGEVNSIVDKIAEATLQYAIPRQENDTLTGRDLLQSSVCALHEPDACALVPFFSRRVEAEKTCTESVMIRAQYLQAYRNGHIAPEIMDILFSATFWPQIFLENPDLETVGRSIGRSIREWTYSILDDALGLPDPYEEDMRENKEESSLVEEEEEDLDELIDVVESDSEDERDPLAPLKDELDRLHGVGETAADNSSTLSQLQVLRTPVVSEYLRRGTRVTQEMVTVRSLHELLSSISMAVTDVQPVYLASRSFDDRMTVLLRAVESDVPPVRELSLEQLIPVLAIRWVLRMMHRRSEETGSKEREKERWTKDEAICFLASFNWTGVPSITPQESLPLNDRHLQLSAQVLQALEQIEHLSQVLLLGDVLHCSVQLYSSRAFHKHLLEGKILESDGVSSKLTEAITYGLETTFREGFRGKKAKRAGKGSGYHPVQSKSNYIHGRGSGLYTLLQMIE